jgi:AMMECR1 domain-containing protein
VKKRYSIISVFLFAICGFTTLGFADLPDPQNPGVKLSDARKLPTLVRSVMLQYLENRCTPESAVVPADLKLKAPNNAKSDAKYAVVVKLRQNGKIVGITRADGNGLIRNTIAAALKVMRSPGLGNHVTKQLLSSLTIEVEILGTEQRIMQKRIVQRLIPGFWGLKLVVGAKDTTISGAYQETYVLPSTSYTLGWDPERMLQQCVIDLPKTPETKSLQRTWYTFSTMHIVGYPSGENFPLFRGKILRTLRESNEKQRLANANRIAQFLVRHQKKDGLFSLPLRGLPTLTSQLYAAYALAEISRQSKQGDRYSVSANALLGYVAKNNVFSHEGKNFACVGTDTGHPSVMATGLFVLTANALPQNNQTRIVQLKMVQFLKNEICKLPPDKTAPSAMAKAIGLVAITRAGEFDLMCEKVLQKLLVLGATEDPNSKTGPRTLAWIGLAGLVAKSENANSKNSVTAISIAKVVAQLVKLQIDLATLPDEIGSIRDTLHRPATTPTAEAAILWSNFARQFQESNDPEAEKICKQVISSATKGQDFCAAMMFIPPEAYFVENRQSLTGGVRKFPGSAEISLDASASTILALISALPEK